MKEATGASHGSGFDNEPLAEILFGPSAHNAGLRKAFILVHTYCAVLEMAEFQGKGALYMNICVSDECVSPIFKSKDAMKKSSI